MTTERMKLAITEVKEVQTVGKNNAQKLSFKAKDKDNKELWFFSFKSSIFEHIKTGATVDVDVETSERDYEKDGAVTHYIDRKVTQLYVDGQLVGGQKDGKGFFGRASNPEERASIESQVAAKIGGELLVAKIITLESKLGVATLNWCLSKMNGFNPSKVDGKIEAKVIPTESKPATKPQTPPNAPESVTKPAEAQASSPEPVEPDIDMAWLKESLEKIPWPDAGKWLREHFKVTGKSVSDMVSRLSPEQQKIFAKEVEDRLSMSYLVP